MGTTPLLPVILEGPIPTRVFAPVRPPMLAMEFEEDRGRVPDEASFGSPEPLFREALLGAPDARFLC